jgi:hypothetical protein
MSGKVDEIQPDEVKVKYIISGGAVLSTEFYR